MCVTPSANLAFSTRVVLTWWKVEALKESHSRQEKVKLELREKYGDTVDHLENLIRELDALSTEITSVSDNAVQLDANFSKYGYSAHLSMYKITVNTGCPFYA